VLKVAAVPSVAALVFPKLVRVMGQRFPGAQRELRDTDTSQVCDALTRGWADIGIASVNQPMNGVTSTELFHDAFGLVMAKSHPLATLDRDITIQDVFEAAFIRNELCEQILLPAFQDELSDVALTVSNLQSLLAMLADGDWVSVLPPSVLPLSGRPLVFRPITGVSDVRRVYLLRRNDVAFPEIVATASEVIADLWP
jgi:DNA-binding transcriptional LysR family regulator